MYIKYINGHYEIVSADSGQFIQSADTWDEAISDMEELLKNIGITGNPARLHIKFSYYKGEKHYEGNR